MAVRNGTTPGPDSARSAHRPPINAQPAAEEINEWSAELDPAKKRAVQLALGTKDVLVIQGPPGTGKTRFIAETVSQLLKKQPDARMLSLRRRTSRWTTPWSDCTRPECAD